FEAVFDIRESLDTEALDFDELPLLACTEADMKDAVINAHKTLMEMTEDNRASFGSLVNALENDSE
ncbi:MAG: anti-anti-sigma factor, partial [Cellvibrionales bacterium]|nr:anti-anti-sigma factor [Cellvibrionales bacterium]